MYTYKLTRVVFNDGTTIEPGRLTVIVGPNNAGKSRALQDIIVKTTTERQEPGIIVRRCEWTLPQNLQELRAAYDFTWYQDEDNVWHYTILTPDLSQELHIHGGFPPTAYEDDQFQRPREEVSLDFARSFGEAMVTFLTTEHRLQLVKEAPSQSYRRHAANLLQALYNAGREVEQIIRELVKQAFGREIALDFTVPQRLLLRVGDDFSRLPLDPREAASTMIQHAKLDEQGDGIRSFVGIVVAMLSITQISPEILAYLTLRNNYNMVS